MSVAVDPRNDDVWITNTFTGHVIKMNKDRQLLDVFGGRSIGPGQFQTPIRAAVDAAGNLYVLDDGGRTCDVRTACALSDANVRIQKFRSDGTFVRAWGSLCEFSFDPATGILSVGVSCNATAPGAVVIGDGQFGFSMELGVLVPTNPQRGFQVSLIGMAVDSLGNVYVADQERVQKFDTNGVLTLKWPAANGTGVAVDFAENVYVADMHNHRVQKFDGTGTFLTKVGSNGRGLGVFRSPAFVAALPKNVVTFCEVFLKIFDPKIQCQKIFVADTGNIRVQALQARQDRDDDSLVNEVDLDPTTASNEAGLGDTGAQVLTRGGVPFVVYDAPGASSPDTLRFTSETSGFPLTSNVAPFCRNPLRQLGVTITIAADNALDFHCSTPTLDVLMGPVGLTFTGADGTLATGTLNFGDSLSVDPATSSIRSNAGTLTLDLGGTSVALAPAQSVFADRTPPITVATLALRPNPSGWNNSDVSVTLTAADNTGGSGVKEIGFSLTGAQAGGATTGGNVATVPISANGVTTLTYFARDKAGNQEAATALTVRSDKTPPTLTFGSPTPGANAAGWNNADVSIAFTTADDLSGVASTTLQSPLALTTEGRGVSLSVTVTDVAGNSATFASPAVNIDKTPPTVACLPVSRPRHKDDERLLLKVTASDVLSGVASIALGTVPLAEGEVILIRPTKRSGVRLVGKSDDDDESDDTRAIKRFRVGPGEAVIKAIDKAGNVGTAVCPLPPPQDDRDHGKGEDGENEGGRNGSNRRVESGR
jgi:hypothetical protein